GPDPGGRAAGPARCAQRKAVIGNRRLPPRARADLQRSCYLQILCLSENGGRRMEVLANRDALQEPGQSALRQCALFRALKPEQIPQLAKAGELVRYDAGDNIVKQGDASDSFVVIMEGDAAVTIDRDGEAIGLGSLPMPASVGEVGLLLNEPRSATVMARSEVMAIRFGVRAFHSMFQKIPDFRQAPSSGLAYRLHEVSDRQLPAHQERTVPSEEILDLLPVDLVQRHRVLPLKSVGNILTLGFVDNPTTQALEA